MKLFNSIKLYRHGNFRLAISMTRAYEEMCIAN